MVQSLHLEQILVGTQNVKLMYCSSLSIIMNSWSIIRQYTFLGKPHTVIAFTNLRGEEWLGEQNLPFISNLPTKVNVKNMPKQVFHGIPVSDKPPHHRIHRLLLNHRYITTAVSILHHALHLGRHYLHHAPKEIHG